ncbi:MAG: sigma-54 dependent transcriptional regulator [Proteobacteria bacterium]|nr:sigma-54 dependent transcriptional regulator [Pseudomonadota bacterium]
MAQVLIVDDDEQFNAMLVAMAQSLGHETTAVVNIKDLRKLAAEGNFDVILLDVRLPDGNGLDLIPELRHWPGEPEVIIITGEGEPDGAELAIKSGVWDYIEKVDSIQTIAQNLSRAVRYREERKALPPRVSLRRESIVGNSPQIEACLDLVAHAANSDASALISGESGTGKELFAKAIHQNSRRAEFPFVVVDCAALPESLVEGILFGHTRGAFTGAERAREGLVKLADRGTLFLDEIGELPYSAQKSFLRVLQERVFRPLGSDKEIQSDFRVVAATNRNLDHMVGQNRFRGDLLFRLQAMTINLPPLRERQPDIQELARHHLARLSAHYGTGIKGLSPEFIEALALYSWPGNVRELISALEWSLAAAGPEPTLFRKHLPTRIRIELVRSSLTGSGAEAPPALEEAPAGPLPTWREYKDQGLAQIERQYIQALLDQTTGDIEMACKISEISRARIYQLMKKHRIDRES